MSDFEVKVNGELEPPKIKRPYKKREPKPVPEKFNAARFAKQLKSEPMDDQMVVKVDFEEIERREQLIQEFRKQEKSLQFKYDLGKFVMDAVRSGRTPREIRKSLTDNYGLSIAEADKYVQEANAILMEEYRDYAAAVAQKNIQSLQLIQEKLLEEGRYKDAISAVAELNKMCGMYSQASIESNGDIKITFG